MKFEDYLKEKKIDSAKFKQGQPEVFEEFKNLYNQVHPNSFTQQKLFLINKIRRNYQLEEQPQEKKPGAVKSMRPKINPLKPKTS